tara:strand:- start:305 stop:451 length:147 start_codon:yes stop_codon:yes gene_type:complete
MTYEIDATNGIVINADIFLLNPKLTMNEILDVLIIHKIIEENINLRIV